MEEKNITPSQYFDHLKWVDLGLPSGIKWASCNLGANSETDYGHYYMWGSVTPNTKTPCDWVHAPFNNGASDLDETYFNSVKDTVCPNGILVPEYDAAQVAGIGRISTKADFEELIENTTNEWIENYKDSGINGRLFTSKTNCKSIFIPASGFRDGSSLLNQGYRADVWSSSLEVRHPIFAWDLYFGSDFCNMLYDNYRCNGCTIRPVSD